MSYRCTIAGCGKIFPRLIDGKIHVYEDHGKSWKKARCYLDHVSKDGRRLI